MSAQRNDRSSPPRRNPEQDPTVHPGRETKPGQPQPPSASGSASSPGDEPSGQPDSAAREQQQREGQQGAQRFMREQQRQQESPATQRQNPEHPERPADGGRREMRESKSPAPRQPGEADSAGQPESGDRGRDPSRRRLES